MIFSLHAGSLNCPYNERSPDLFERHLEAIRIVASQALKMMASQPKALASATSCMSDVVPICVVCRRGNDSQSAVQLLRRGGFENVFDLAGGLTAWACDGGTFPHI